MSLLINLRAFQSDYKKSRYKGLFIAQTVRAFKKDFLSTERSSLSFEDKKYYHGKRDCYLSRILELECLGDYARGVFERLEVYLEESKK